MKVIVRQLHLELIAASQELSRRAYQESSDGLDLPML